MPDGGFVAHLAPSGDPFSNGWNAAMKLQASQPTSRCLPMPVNVIFHNPATIVFWDDGDKTVVKCQPGDTFSAEAGLTAAMLKKYMGNDNTFNKVINEWLARASYASVPALPEATEKPMDGIILLLLALVLIYTVGSGGDDDNHWNRGGGCFA